MALANFITWTPFQDGYTITTADTQLAFSSFLFDFLPHAETDLMKVSFYIAMLQS